MTQTDTAGTLHLDRVIPVPSSVSAEAQHALAQGAAFVPDRLAAADSSPALDDADAWRAAAAVIDKGVIAMNASLEEHLVEVERVCIGGVDVVHVTPREAPQMVVAVAHLDFHGGAFIGGGGEACRGMAIRSALRTGLETWSVDYRMPPDHPFPAALDDGLGVYRALLEEHPAERVVVGGQSAGGNLAATLVHRARAEGLPVPGALVLLTPKVDFTLTGDTYETNKGVDTVLVTRITAMEQLYTNGHDVTDPLLTPFLGELRGFPPTFLQTGTRDLLLSDTVRMHRALRTAGVDADLHVWEAMPHGGFLNDAPEDDEIGVEIRKFLTARFAS